MALTHVLTPCSKIVSPGLVQLCVHAWVHVHVCMHMCSTHSCGQAGWGICPHSYILGGGADGVSSALPSCLLPSDSSPLLCRGREASRRIAWVLVPGWLNIIEAAPAGLCSAQQPVTLGLPYLSLSKAGTRVLFHCCKGHPHPLCAQHFPRSWRGMYTPGSLTLNQFETGRTAFSQSGNRGPCLQDQDGAFSQGGGPGPFSCGLDPLSSPIWLHSHPRNLTYTQISVRHGGSIDLSLQLRLRQED